MKNPVFIAESPNKPTVKYIVQTKSESIEETFAPLVEQIKWQQTSVDQVIIFCAYNEAATHIFHFIKAGSVKKSRNQLVIPIFLALGLCLLPAHKDIILQLFPNPSGHMHVIVATIAFTMGL